jgi:hypothetical protein
MRIQKGNRNLLNVCAAVAILAGCSSGGSLGTGASVEGSTVRSVSVVPANSQSAPDARHVTEFLQSHGLLQSIALNTVAQSNTCRTQGQKCGRRRHCCPGLFCGQGYMCQQPLCLKLGQLCLNQRLRCCPGLQCKPTLGGYRCE